jgi:hypothetical protein
LSYISFRVPTSTVTHTLFLLSLKADLTRFIQPNC